MEGKIKVSGMTGKKHSEEAKLKMSLAKRGRHISPSTEFKKGSQAWKNRKTLKGPEHPSWKENLSYSGIHQWISKELGKPKECWDCGFTSDNGRRFHWANISGEYKRDVNDWERLCASCHFKKDDILNRGWRTRRRLA